MNIIIDSMGVAAAHGFDDYVARITWRVTAETNKTYEDGSFVVIAESRKSVFDLTNPSDPFVPFSDLTENVVISWIADTPEYEEAVSKLQNRLIAENAPPTSIKQLPWLSSTESYQPE